LGEPGVLRKYDLLVSAKIWFLKANLWELGWLSDENFPNSAIEEDIIMQD
jgi:hypothetical protein